MTGVEADVVVVGLGVHGTAAAAELARRGHRVIGIDRFPDGHVRGSSHGRTRMIRRAYPHPVWNDLVERAYSAWDDLARESGTTLVRRTGGVYGHVGASQLQGPGCEQLAGAAEAAERMPSLRLPDGYRAVWDPAAGVLEASDALAVLRARARRHGAQLRHGASVAGWDTTASGVRVTVDGEPVRAARLVIAGGPWMGRLVPVLSGLLEVWRILTVTASAGQPVAAAPQLGAFSVDRPEGLVFGIPDVAGNGLKIGVDVGQVWDPDEPVAAATTAEVAQLGELMRTYVPGVDVDGLDAAACLYTMTADRRFIIGALAESPEVVVASACSGHGFKFGAAIGEALADLVEDVPRPDLDFVSTARRGL
ncbi:N-methyl-L-tryptophan oxidase [Microbacterium sp. NPDC091313]